MGQWRRGGRGRVSIVAALLAAAAIGAGCGPSTPPSRSPDVTIPASAPALATTPVPVPTVTLVEPSPAASPLDAAPGRLVLLAGRPGAMALEVVGSDGRRMLLSLPDADVAWISTDATGRILATTRSGQTFLSAPPAGDGPAWRELVPHDAVASSPATPLSFGTLNVDGSLAAFIAADFRTDRPSQLVIVATDDGAVRAIPLGRPADGAPPAWIGARVALLTRERSDAPGVTVVDPRDGRVSPGPGPGGSPTATDGYGRVSALSIAAAGSTAAFAAQGDGPIGVVAAGPWLDGRPIRVEDVQLEPGPDGSASFAWLALDASGDRLAVVRTDAEGDAVGVTVRSAERGWDEILAVALPDGADRAVVAWRP